MNRGIVPTWSGITLSSRCRAVGRPAFSRIRKLQAVQIVFVAIAVITKARFGAHVAGIMLSR